MYTATATGGEPPDRRNKTAEIAQTLGISQCRILQIKHDLADRYTKVESEIKGEIRFRKVVQK